MDGASLVAEIKMLCEQAQEGVDLRTTARDRGVESATLVEIDAIIDDCDKGKRGDRDTGRKGSRRQ